MRSHHTAVTTSQSAEAIRTYCHTLAQELGLTLEDVWWGHALCPDHVENPYNLPLSIAEPLNAISEFWFTDEQVLGYTTGETRAAIEREIRQDLEIRIRDDL